MTQTDSPPDPEARYGGVDSGRVLTYRQIGYIRLKTATSVERTDDRFTVEGEQFKPIANLE